ncbi:MAG: GNAT family N-acetyltransferase [Acidobacteria bacterium]|nr:GNAT family N-acetyltransferase [Acidobacteriota bacterium]MBP7476406.1 GNAT family N-acetyltransferase [Pyrinomonadaceae bacterium]
MGEITVRVADTTDLPTLLSFEEGVIEAERPFDVTLGDDIRYYDMDAMLTMPNVRLVVAVLDGEVIGSGYARIEEAKPYLKHDRHSYMGFMYTVPEHRGKGVNWKIIEALEEWSRSQGVTEMRLEVYADNLAAIRAYEKVGFAGYGLKMRKGLE